MSRYIPNLITAFRLVGSPVMAFYLLKREFRTVLVIVILAGISDGLDGYAARKLGAKGETGVILDPLADKAMLVTLFVVLGVIGAIPFWLLVLVIARDLIIVGGAVLLRTLRGLKGFRPTRVGKFSTFFQIILVLLVLLQLSFPHFFVLFLERMAVGLTAIFTTLSGLDYIRKGCQMAGWIPAETSRALEKIH